MRSRDWWVEWLVGKFAISRDDAEDLMQASLIYFTGAYLNENPDAGEADVERYLAEIPDALISRTLRWRFRDLVRARTREQQALEHWAACQLPAEDPEQDALENLELERMLAQIPESARDVVRLWLEGYRWQEIAQRLGISASAAKMRFNRAIEALRANLGIRCDAQAVCGVNLSGECKKEALHKNL